MFTPISFLTRKSLILKQLRLVAQALEAVLIDDRNQIVSYMELFSHPVADTGRHADLFCIIHHPADIVDAQGAVGSRASALFFVVGVAFARYISLPFVLRFLIQFTGEVDVAASISIQQYVGFLLTIFVVFGLVFELPVVSVLLTGLGLIRAEWLKAGRKIMIVIIFVLAAIITPPDVVSQIMVAVPMILLYELSIALSSLVGRRRKDAEDDEDTAEEA